MFPGNPREELQTRVEQLTAELAKTRQQLSEKAELFDLASEAISVLERGRIVLWSQGAERLYGWSRSSAVGKSAAELLQTQFPIALEQIEKELNEHGQWKGELTQTTREGKSLEVASRCLLRRQPDGSLRWIQIDSDITERKHAEEELRALSGRMLNLRDAERRRLARELHDSAGQILVAASVNLCLLEEKAGRLKPETAKLLADTNKLIGQALDEIRTISHLLHPPLLDEVGLFSALRWYVDGFAERSKIKVEMEIPEDLGRLRRELEIAVFRIVQEGLTNIHRHSGSATAKISIWKAPQRLKLTVADHGKGLALTNTSDRERRITPGVGISGIKERVRQLGGQMQIHSGDWGTSLEIEFPLLDAALE